MRPGLLAWIACVAIGTAACGGGSGGGDGSSDGAVAADGGDTTGGPGDSCTLTRSCAEGLYCSELRTCQPAGSGADGAPCGHTGDCLRGLVCVREPEGWLCRPAGDRGVGESCLRHEQCEAGLSCHGGECTGAAADAGTGTGGFDGGSTACTAGGAECDDGSPCTTDQCIADGCVHTLIDSDRDGYASTLLGSCGLDCADMDEGAHPDQEGFSATRHGGGPGQPETFDWNCDGAQEKRWPEAITCEIGLACDAGEGWLDPVPDCGATGRWGRCGSGCAGEVLEPARQQTCR